MRKQGVRIALGQLIYGQSDLIPSEARINHGNIGQSPVYARTDRQGIARFVVRSSTRANGNAIYFQSLGRADRGLPVRVLRDRRRPLALAPPVASGSPTDSQRRYPWRQRAVSSVGRAPARQAGGHWFEPSTAHCDRARDAGPTQPSGATREPGSLRFHRYGRKRSAIARLNPAAIRAPEAMKRAESGTGSPAFEGCHARHPRSTICETRSAGRSRVV